MERVLTRTTAQASLPPAWLLSSAVFPVRKKPPFTKSSTPRSFLWFRAKCKPHCSLHVRLWGHSQIQPFPSSSTARSARVDLPTLLSLFRAPKSLVIGSFLTVQSSEFLFKSSDISTINLAALSLFFSLAPSLFSSSFSAPTNNPNHKHHIHSHGLLSDLPSSAPCRLHEILGH